MKWIALALVASSLVLSGCSPSSGYLTPTGTGQTPSGGLVPGQTPH